jgi:hypothetical protein
MTDKQKIEFLQMQVMYFERMSKYPEDKEALHKMHEIFFDWIDKQINDAMSKYLGANSKLISGGVVKSIRDKN